MRDLPSIKLQAISIARFVDASLLNKVIYVFNDEEELLHQKHRDDLIEIFQGIDFKLTNYRELERSRRIAENDGWLSQQSLKLQVAKLVETEFYLVLDAKNHFIRRVSENDFFTDLSIPKMPVLNTSRFDVKDLNFHMRYFDICEDQRPSDLILNVTPFLMNRTIVGNLCDYIEDKEQLPVDQAFTKHYPDMLEFLAYQFYCAKIGLKISDYYSNDERVETTIWKHQSKNKKAFEDAILGIESRKCPIFALHWIAFIHLDNDKIQTVKNLWLKCGLLDTEADADYYYQDQKKSVEMFVSKLPKGFSLHL